MRRSHLALAVAILGMLMAGPALAHRLKLFVAVEGEDISGYAFFVGGGRPDGARLRVEDAAGRVVHEGLTDAEGAFRWRVPAPGAYSITVNAGDGHGATALIPADRFAGAASAPQAEAVAPAPLPAPSADDRTAALVAAAVQKEVAPLLMRIEQLDNRLRLTDLVSGVFLILGAAGGLMWASARRRRG